MSKARVKFSEEEEFIFMLILINLSDIPLVIFSKPEFSEGIFGFLVGDIVFDLLIS